MHKFIYFLLVVVIVVMAWGFFGLTNALAMGDDMRSNACRTYHTFSHQKENDTRNEVDGLSCGNSETVKVKRNQAVVETAVIEPVTVETVQTVQPETNKPETVDKPKGNNGEGNGGEGFSPAQSENANNDENDTTPKEDKSKGKG